MPTERHRGLYASIPLGFPRELRQLLPVPLQEFLVDVAVGVVAPDFVALAGEQRLLISLRDLHVAAHTSTSSGITSGLALRPARSIGFSIMPIIALSRSRIFQKSTARSTSSRDASRNASLAFTCRTLFCMSSASQPRECAMNGNGGDTNPKPHQDGNIRPPTAATLSWPP